MGEKIVEEESEESEDTDTPLDSISHGPLAYPPPSPAHTRSWKAKKTRVEEHFIKVTKVNE